MPQNLINLYGGGALHFIMQLAIDTDRGDTVTKVATGLLGDIIKVCGNGVGGEINKTAVVQQQQCAAKGVAFVPFYSMLVTETLQLEAPEDRLMEGSAFQIAQWTKALLEQCT